MTEQVPAPEKKKTTEAPPTNGMTLAFQKAGINGPGDFPTRRQPEAPPAPAEEATTVPPELREIYSDHVPPKVLKMLGKLKSPAKRKSYIEQLRAGFASENQRKIEKLREDGILPPLEPPAEAAEEASDVESPNLATAEPASEISPVAQAFEAQEQRDIDARIEAAHAETEVPVIPNPEDAIDREHVQEVLGTEGTPKEWRQKLRSLIEGAKEKVAWWKNSEEHLLRRLGELDTEAEKIGGTEKLFRSMGEKYNKLGWKSKLAVGVSLGLGAGLTASVSVPAALAFTFGIAAQRVAGLATMYLKFERNAHEEKWGKEKAMGKAILYTAGMTGAMMLLVEGVREGVDYANQQQWGEAMREWLGEMLGHPSQAHVGPTVTGRITMMPEVQQPAAVSNGAETAASGGMIEIPMLSVEAARGYGYEFMAKRLWEQLQALHLDPRQYAEGSDIRRLLEADPDSIDKVVHQIAADPAHGFFNPDGTSIRIDPGAHLSIGDDGSIRLNDVLHAPAGAPPPPVYHPGASAAAPPLERVDIPQHEAVQTVDLTPGQHPAEDVVPAPATVPPDNNLIWHDSEGRPITDSEGNPIRTGVHDASPEGVQPAPEVSPAEGIITNQAGLEIPTAEPHLYADESTQLFVYGGSPDEQSDLVRSYLRTHPGGSIYGTDQSGVYRVRLFLSGGKLAMSAPERTTGFLGIFSSLAKPPEPEEFQKIIQ